VFNVKAGVPVWSSTSAVTTALILLLGIGVAEAVNPTRGNRAAFSSAMLIAAASRLNAWSALKRDPRLHRCRR
jgi:hypothetical protein